MQGQPASGCPGLPPGMRVPQPRNPLQEGIKQDYAQDLCRKPQTLSGIPVAVPCPPMVCCVSVAYMNAERKPSKPKKQLWFHLQAAYGQKGFVAEAYCAPTWRCCTPRTGSHALIPRGQDTHAQPAPLFNIPVFFYWSAMRLRAMRRAALLYRRLRAPVHLLQPASLQLSQPRTSI